MQYGNRPMIDVRQIMRDAIAGVPLSLRDDPTAWADGGADRDYVLATLRAAAADNATSALAKAFGDAAERIATDMDAAITEDGPLADLDAVWAAAITGVRPRLPDLSPVAAATDWQARVDALRVVMADVIRAATTDDQLAAPAEAQFDALIEADPRLAHLAEPFTPPAFLNPGTSDIEAGEVVWDDEPAETTDWSDEEPVAAAPVETNRRGRGKRAGTAVPKLCGLLEAAGFADKDTCALLGIDKSTYSLMRTGKRPWQGVRDDAAVALAAEIRGRSDALAEALAALGTSEVRHPETP